MQFRERGRRTAAEQPFCVEASVCRDSLVALTVEHEVSRALRNLFFELAAFLFPERRVDE